MEVNLEKGTVMIYSKSYKLDTLAAKLGGLNGKQIYDFFSGRGMMLPRKMHRMALMSVLNARIAELTSNSLPKEYFQRLQFYANFTELQLENLFNAIAQPEDFKQYRTNFIKLVLINYVSINLTDGELMYLNNVRKLSMEPFEEYVKFVSAICYEQSNGFDGEDMTVLAEVLPQSASVAEINKYGEKYGLQVNSRLTKDQFVDYLVYWLQVNNEYSEDLEDEIGNMTVAELNAFCKANNINMSSNMTKQQTVIYLFYYLSQCEISTTSINRIETLPMYEPIAFRVDLSVASAFGTKEPKKIIYLDNVIETDEDGNTIEAYEEIPKPAKKAPKKKLKVVVNKRYEDSNAEPVIPVVAYEKPQEEEVYEEAPVEEVVASPTEEVVYEEAPVEEVVYEEAPQEEVVYEEAPQEEEVQYVEEPEYVEEVVYEEAPQEEEEQYAEEEPEYDAEPEYVEVEYEESTADGGEYVAGDAEEEHYDESPVIAPPSSRPSFIDEAMERAQQQQENPTKKEKKVKAKKEENPDALPMDVVYENEKYGSKEYINLDKGKGGLIAKIAASAIAIGVIAAIIIYIAII